MPRKPQWLPRVTEIIELVESCHSQAFDRSAIEFLFNVQRTTAAELMRSISSQRVGTSAVVAKRDLLLWLAGIVRSGAYQREADRRSRIADTLEQLRESQRARNVRIPASTREAAELEGLPGVRLRPGRLEVDFFGAEDLLRCLWELSKAAAADYPKFQSLTEDPGFRRTD
jgi:hypothetical protein